MSHVDNCPSFLDAPLILKYHYSFVCLCICKHMHPIQFIDKLYCTLLTMHIYCVVMFVFLCQSAVCYHTLDLLLVEMFKWCTQHMGYDSKGSIWVNHIVGFSPQSFIVISKSPHHFCCRPCIGSKT